MREVSGQKDRANKEQSKDRCEKKRRGGRGDEVEEKEKEEDEEVEKGTKIGRRVWGM